MAWLQQLVPLPRNVFRYLCLLTALANGLGNIFLLLFYRPLFELLGVPLPQDMASFVFVAGFSFTVGVLAFLVFLNPEQNVNLLLVGIVGKGIYAFSTFYSYVFGRLHWFYLTFGAWDALFVVIFFLFLIQLLSADLSYLNGGDVFTGLNRPPTHQALLLGFSLTGNGRRSLDRVKAGLESNGYKAEIRYIEAEEDIFRFPMSFLDFIKIIVRAFFRRPARIKPLGIPTDHSYDLLVVESPTWLVGMAAPVESVFLDPANRAIFEGRDAATVNVARGAWRRSQAMAVRWLESCGANVVGARAYTHTGWEPSRLFSLWFYLVYHKAGMPKWLDGFVQKHYGPPEEAYRELEQFGEDLAQRKRTGVLAATAVA